MWLEGRGGVAEGLSGGRWGRARSQGPWLTAWSRGARHGVVWPSQPCPAGEKLDEQLGACHYDAGQTGGGIEKENAIGSGHILKIKPTGLLVAWMWAMRGKWAGCFQPWAGRARRRALLGALGRG